MHDAEQGHGERRGCGQLTRGRHGLLDMLGALLACYLVKCTNDSAQWAQIHRLCNK
jgi:hypothetical protein